MSEQMLVFPPSRAATEAEWLQFVDEMIAGDVPEADWLDFVPEDYRLLLEAADDEAAADDNDEPDAQDLSFREKLVYTLDRAAALKAWETRQRNKAAKEAAAKGEGAKGNGDAKEPSKFKLPALPTDRDVKAAPGSFDIKKVAVDSDPLYQWLRIGPNKSGSRKYAFDPKTASFYVAKGDTNTHAEMLAGFGIRGNRYDDTARGYIVGPSVRHPDGHVYITETGGGSSVEQRDRAHELFVALAASGATKDTTITIRGRGTMAVSAKPLGEVAPEVFRRKPQDTADFFANLSFRDKIAYAISLREDSAGPADRSAAAKKAWDTRGRSDKRDKGGSSGRVKGGGGARAHLRAADPKKDAARLKELRVPPAWTDVQIADDAEADLQATGRDVKGRLQYKYSAEHSKESDAEKFGRLKEFGEALPKLRTAIEADLDSDDPATQERATVLYLIEKTAFRPGSTRETKAAVQAYGASTLESRHVKVKGDKVSFNFTGKKGVEIKKTITDAKLARALEGRITRGKARLFKETSDDDLREYLDSKAPGFKVKDFRTHSGTALAIRTIAGMKTPTTDKDFKKAQREVAKVVSEHLGNTPTVALASYINPAAFSKWKAGRE